MKTSREFPSAKLTTYGKTVGLKMETLKFTQHPTAQTLQDSRMENLYNFYIHRFLGIKNLYAFSCIFIETFAYFKKLFSILYHAHNQREICTTELVL